MKIELLQDIIIPKGTIIEDDGPIESKYAKNPFHYCYGIGIDGCAYFIIPRDDWQYDETLFRLIKENK